MSGAPEMTVLVHDDQGDRALPRGSGFRILRDPDQGEVGQATNLFVLASALRLGEVAKVVHLANQSHHLRALFVREDTDPSWLPQLFNRATLRTFRNTLVHSGPELPRRVMNAWHLGAQDQLIARAVVENDRLRVINCALNEFEIGFERLPALARLPVRERRSFEIAEDGSYMHWPASDVHLDLEAIRIATEPEWKERSDVARLAHDERFGGALAKVRKAHGLRQADIPGLSERQVRRIEAGGSPKVSSLQRFAKAHGLSLNKYLEEVARVA